MNHQVEHHRHVIGPVRVGAVAAGLEHNDLFAADHSEQLAEGGVEALNVTDLQQLAGQLRRPNQIGRLLLGGGDRFFNQNVQPSLEGSQSHLVVQQGGHRNADGLHLPQQVAVIRVPLAVEFLNRQLAAILIGIGHPHQLRIPQQAEHPGMVPAHVADADDPDTHRVHGQGNAVRTDYRRWRGTGGGRLGLSHAAVPPKDRPTARTTREKQPGSAS